MKLARYGSPGQERPAIVDAAGNLRDASGLVADIDVAAIERLRGIEPATLPLVAPGERMGVPFVGIGKFLAIGLNYRDHAAESGMAIPTEPILFAKAITCLAGPDDDVPLPRGSEHTDWEIELGVVIGRRARYVSEQEALDHVAGFVLVNDLSERRDQHERGGTWDKGKGHDGFGPVGPWLVTPDEIGEGRGLALQLAVNGEVMQDGTTDDMIFGVAEIVSYVSRFCTLVPGDLIATGTPAGVGAGRKPPRYLKTGDVLDLSGTGLGRQRQRIVAAH